ncbi:MAG: hypothetical protein WAQ53_13890 [Thiofilum sp.]|uniref:hypothetical protein n=1 Tax=Thiofilum sp. TaxID=2212733 RepID=UPI0025DA6CFC|nr:hypothetical protein [Thiofilum sp.]MBK8453953.1 hypothetical protein [Thiofilum sp.]
MDPTRKPSQLYRSKWACFHCRTAFVRYIRVEQSDQIRCLTCHTKATDMGYLFEPPRRSDYKQWRLMQLLAQHQLRYHRSGMIPKIRYLITENDKASYTEVQRNLMALYDDDQQLKKKEKREH